MCGRLALYSPPSRLAAFLDATLAAGINPAGEPHWNVGPQHTIFGVSEHDGVRVLDAYRWGLVPSWAKDASMGSRLFNARGESVNEKPSFRSAFVKRPCAIPADGFYEWDHRPGHHRQPHYFTRVDGDPILLAGLYEFWRDSEKDELLATCTIITTTPNPDIDDIHDRMPVVLSSDDVEVWLNVDEHNPEERLLLLRPSPAGTLAHHGVATVVGSLKNDGPLLIEPVEPSTLF